jgi:hypothetical protein
MAKVIRYALATICFAASVGCLALWWRSYSYADLLISPSSSGSSEFMYGSASGSAYFVLDETMQPSPTWRHSSSSFGDTLDDGDRPPRMFGVYDVGIWFPLWYPALVFALTGVAALRFRRQFSIRAALIAVSVVAALLGMVVAL